MKRLIFILLAVGNAAVSFGQKTFILSLQDKKGFVAVGSGVSVPMGAFTTGNQMVRLSPGWMQTVSAGYRLLGPVGLTARFSYSQHAETASRTPANPFIIQTVLVGPYVSLPVSRFSVDVRLLVGQATLRHQSATPQHLSDKAMAYGGGFAVRYRLSAAWSVQIASDYTQLYIRANDTPPANPTNGLTTGEVSGGMFQSVSNVGVSAGVAFLFANAYRPF